nr:poly(A) polymerase I-like isoform X1 [Ipomoea batatas]GMD34438.1 poly(A) polymerase I-like isoform X1 [Ipomoea batatas]
MATSTGFALSCRPNLTLRHCLHKITRKAAVMAFNDTDKGKALEWKRFNSKDLGIRTSAITKPTRVVLNSLKKKGFDVYLVGGSVRDLVLKRTPKDFDVITSADLREVKRTFSQCEIVGRRFPICHVCIDDTIVEVRAFIPVQESPKGIYICLLRSLLIVMRRITYAGRTACIGTLQ